MENVCCGCMCLAKEFGNSMHNKYTHTHPQPPTAAAIIHILYAIVSSAGNAKRNIQTKPTADTLLLRAIPRMNCGARAERENNWSKYTVPSDSCKCVGASWTELRTNNKPHKKKNNSEKKLKECAFLVLVPFSLHVSPDVWGECEHKKKSIMWMERCALISLHA